MLIDNIIIVVFGTQGENVWTETLYERLMKSGQIYLVTAMVQAQLVIRFVVCSRLTEESDVEFAWKEIQAQTNGVCPVGDAMNDVYRKVSLDEGHVAKSLMQG